MILDDLLEEVQQEANRRNGSVLGEALNELRNVDVGEVRRKFLRMLPPTCQYRIYRRKLRKASQNHDHVRSWGMRPYFVNRDWNISATDRIRISDDVIQRYEKYSRLVDQHRPCGECFSCRVSRGQVEFFRRALPRIVAELVREASEEVEIFVKSVLNGEFDV